jgi:hypothetical protein
MKKGEEYAWAEFKVHMVCKRVAKDGSWADFDVWGQHGGAWGKRLPLPQKGLVKVVSA